MSNSLTLQSLASQLTSSVSAGNLILNKTAIPSATFGWSLQTMGLTTLTVQIADATIGIVYDVAKSILTITGNCSVYTGWDAVPYTIILSSGDDGHTVSYANTAISGAYATFNIQKIAGSGLIPANAVAATLLPAYVLNDVPMQVLSSSASTLPNCNLTFGLQAAAISPPWALVSSLGLNMDTMGFQVVNSMNKTGIVSNSFSLSGNVTIGAVETTITVTLPVDVFSQSNTWSLAFSSAVGQSGLNIANLVQNLAGVNVYQEFPASLTALLEFTLTYFYVQFDPASVSVSQVLINIGAPAWSVIPDQFSIQETNFGVQLMNPFSKNARSTTFFVNGTFVVGGSLQHPLATLTVAATLPLGASDWFFNISGEIDHVDYSTLIASTPGMNSYAPPPAPTGFQLDKITLNYLNISFNPKTLTLTEVDLSVASVLDFPIVPNVIGLQNPYFSLRLTNPLSAANNDYSGNAGGDLTLTNAPFLELDAAVAKTTGWVFTASLATGATINIIDMLDQFFAKDSTVPDWVGSTLEITAFRMVIQTPPSNVTTQPTAYHVSGTVLWKLSYQAFSLPAMTANVMVDYLSANGTKPAETSGSITVSTTLFGLNFLIGYQFGANLTEVYLIWNGIKANYTSTSEYSKYSLTVSKQSLGSLITSVMSDLIPGFTLSAPWNVLNDVNLDGLSIVCTQYIQAADQAKNNLVVSIPVNLNLGFIDIKTATLTRMGSGTGAQTYLGFTGTFLGFAISADSSNESAKQLAGQGAPVNDMPAVPGLGGNIFDLQYFGLGQHVALYPTQNLTTVTQTVDELQRVFTNPPIQQPGQKPLIPIPPNPSSVPQKSVLIFDENSNWLIGLECLVMNTVKLGVVFNDPNLYGLAVGLSGESAGVFSGLNFEILYKKVNDSIGVYQLDLQLPTAMRTLELGEVSITLPSAAIQIYTNGNFMVDLGFPWSNNFARSFTIQVFPFIGQGGIYFGVLNGATSTNVPTSLVGSFNPVIELGVGLSLGVGKNINEGILSAGLSLMAVGVFQGVLARFNVNDTSLYHGDGQYYYKATGTFGLTGRIYGSINFAIISASFDLTAYAYITISLECYNVIDISFTAGVSISLTVTVNLGIFKIHITLKFSATISASFTIGSNNTANAPWNQPLQSGQQNNRLLRSGFVAQPSYEILWQPIAPDSLVPLKLMYLPLLSLSNASGTIEAQFVNMLFIDAPDPALAEAPVDSAFTTLATATLQWAINAIVNSNHPGTITKVSDLMNQGVTVDQLQAIYDYLTYESDDFFPILYANLSANQQEYDIRNFLKNYFQVEIQAQNLAEDTSNTATVFPVFPDLMLNYTINGTAGTPVDLSANPLPFSYLESVEEDLNKLNVGYQSAAEAANDVPDNLPLVNDSALPATPPDLSFATFIIQDYFEMLVKNVVQDAIHAFDQFKYAPALNQTLGEIVNNFTQPPLQNHLTATDVVAANADAALLQGISFVLTGITYPIASGDTLNSIAAAYNADLAVANHISPSDFGTPLNAGISGLIIQGTLINVAGFNSYTVIATDSLNTIAAALIPVTGNLQATVNDVILNIADAKILTTLALIHIPLITYTTGTVDSFQTLAAKYGVKTNVLAEANLQAVFNVPSLIIPTIATLKVSDLISQVIVLENINRYSGMAARFLLHGLNLPDPAAVLTTRPLYVLTGQQMEIPTLVASDIFNLELAAGANGSWIGIDETAASLNVNSNEISRINSLLTKSSVIQDTSPQPPAAITLYQDAFQIFTLKSQIAWQYPGTLVLPVGTAPEQVVGTPSIWYFPDTLTAILQATPTKLPLQLLLQTLNADGNTYTQNAIQNYGWATLVNIGVEKLNGRDEGAAIFGNTYNLTGASGADIVYLERIVAALNSGNGPQIDQVRVMYDPNPTGNASTDGVQSLGDGAYQIGVVKINISTETNPEGNMMMARVLEETAYAAPEPNTVNSYVDFLSFVWECSITRSGGFYLYFNETDGNAGLPDALFSSNPMANLYLLVTYQGASSGDYLNAVAVGDQVDTSTSVLFIQSEALTTRNATIPPGNTGFELTLKNPGAYTPIVPYPLVPNAESNAEDVLFLQNQFNLIGYKIVENSAFLASAGSLMPAGPLNTSNPESKDEDPEMTKWPYSGTVSVYSLALNKIQPDNPSFPPAAGDPYSGNGNSVSIQLALLDLFGNPINSNLSGTAGLITTQLGYTDNLVALSQWPNVSSRYSFPTIAGTPHLQVDLCFDATRYQDNPNGNLTPVQLAQADLQTYAKIYYQLIQTDVEVSYRSSLYTSAEFPEGISLTPNQKLSDFAGTLYAYLANIVAGNTQTITIPVPWSLVAPVEATNMNNIFALDIDLTITRTENIHPDFADVEAVLSVTTAIQPITQELCNSDASAGATLDYFAKGFETTFQHLPAENVTLKIAAGVDSQEVSGSGNSQKVWVVRFDPLGVYGMGVSFEQGDQAPIAYYYSPTPLSTSLISINNTPISPYVSGTPFVYDPNAASKNFASVDLDQWGLVCLQAIDNFLTPQFSVPAFLIDQGVSLQTILDAKNELANAITGTVSNILDQPLTHAQILNVQEVFNQQLLISLGNAYNISTIIQHPLTVKSQYNGSNTAPLSGSPINPRLYGSLNGNDPQPVGNIGADTADLSKQYSFTNGKIPLGTGASWVNYCLYVKDASQVESFRFSKIDFVLSNIEHQIEDVPNVEGYQASTWLAFVIPLNTDTFNTGGIVDVPVPLRAYPVPPSVTAQLADYDQNNVSGNTTTITEALTWGFGFEYSQQEATQDLINAQVSFNTSIPKNILRAVPSVTLPAALAQFIQSLPELTADYLKYVAAVSPQDIKDHTDIAKKALSAVQSLGALATLVAQGWSTQNQYHAWPPVPSDKMFTEVAGTGADAQGLDFNYTIQESETSAGEPDSPLLLTVTLDDQNPAGMDAPQVSIAGYTSVKVDQTAEIISFNFVDENKNYLSYANRQQISTRKFELKSLKLMAYQEGWAGLQITRNQNLVSTYDTDPLFQYQTPLVRFYTPLAPMLTANAQIDIAAIASGQPLAAPLAVQLQNLFNAIFDNYGWAISPTIRLEALYSYNLSGDSSWNQINLPVFLSLPSVLNLPADLDISNCASTVTEGTPFLCAIANTLIHWFNGITPSTQHGMFTFKLIIYAGVNNTTPLISLNNLTLAITEITDLQT